MRHEAYESFLKWPHADLWETLMGVGIEQELEDLVPVESTCDDESSMVATDIMADIDYRIFCLLK